MTNQRFILTIAIFGAVLMAVATALGLLWWFANYASNTGEKESAWLREDMWGEAYFGARSNQLEHYEIDFIKSLNAGSSRDQSLITAVVRHKCYDSSWRCSVIMTTAGNLILDSGDYKVGLRGAVEAHERISGQCSVVFESAIAFYHIRNLSLDAQKNVGNRAAALLKKIEDKGGLMSNLRSKECRALALSRPEYFTTYAMLTANLMELAGGRYAMAAAYLKSLKK